MDVAYHFDMVPECMLHRAVDFFGADKVMTSELLPVRIKEMMSRAVSSTQKLTAVEKHKVLHDTGYRILADWESGQVPLVFRFLRKEFEAEISKSMHS